jgi:hypothetical protein
MFAKCSNPQCGTPFDHREGQLIRSSASPLDGQSVADQHRVEHFWLCGSCSKLYVFEYKLGTCMKIRPRVREPREVATVSIIKVA